MNTDLSMYVAPPRVTHAQAAWLAGTLELLHREYIQGEIPDLVAQWLDPELLLSQTCGYPLITTLRDKVKLVGRPAYELLHSSAGQHCSLLLCRDDGVSHDLRSFIGRRGILNSYDSNSGMNLFRHTLAEVHQGAFFDQVLVSGGHRASIAMLQASQGDLAAIDSVTYDYLAREQGGAIEGLQIIARSQSVPCLPFITSDTRTDGEVDEIRNAMNRTLAKLPWVAQELGISTVLPTTQADYLVLLELEQAAIQSGFSFC